MEENKEEKGGDDLMVEVFGSNVYVGGVCTSGEGGDDGGEEVDPGETIEVEMGSGGNVGGMSLCAEAVEKCNESLKGAGATGVDAEKAEKERKLIGGLLEEVFGRGNADGGRREKKGAGGGGDDLKKGSVVSEVGSGPGLMNGERQVSAAGDNVSGAIRDDGISQVESNGRQNSKTEQTRMNSVGKDQLLKSEKSSNDNVTTDDSESKALHEVDVSETDLDALSGEMQEQPESSEERGVIGEATQPETSDIEPHHRYELPQKYEGTFSVADLVWGKVKSHPWWPGQIFDFMAASEKAMKHHKKDCFLVAYFGDQTFAWNEVSSLKPFQSYFSQAQKQNSPETFHKAVDCVLEEVSRRLELGLACSCIPKDVYEMIRFQNVENAGICRESSRVERVADSANASSFESDKLLRHVKDLAQFPSGGSDKLEFVIAKAHLTSFFRSKGYYSLPEFQHCGNLLESETENLVSEGKPCPYEITEHAASSGKDKKTGPEVEELKPSSSHKRKHNLREGAYAKMKERSMSELMGAEDGNDWFDEKASPSSSKRWKGADSEAVNLATQDGRKAVSASPKPSFKIGACIQRAASQLSGSTIVKSSTDRPVGQGSDVSFQSSDDTLRGVNATKYSSLDELLSQLRLAAEEPGEEYSFLTTIVSFFFDFRNSVVVDPKSGVAHSVPDKVGRKRKSNAVRGSPETFEFDDMNDTYWTDMVVHNGGEEEAPTPLPPRKRRPKSQPVVLAQPEKPPQVARRPYNRKKFSQGSQDLPPDKPVGYVHENAPAELMMNFSEVNSIPSETNLNKVFKRFGPLKEYDTEIDRESSRARVVFKRCSDAEVACNSARTFKILGQITVTYQLNYTPSQFNYTPAITFDASTSGPPQDHEVQLDFPSQDHEMHLDLSTHDEMQLDLSTHDHMQLDLSTHDDMQLDLSTFEVNLV